METVCINNLSVIYDIFGFNFFFLDLFVIHALAFLCYEGYYQIQWYLNKYN